MPLVVVHAAFLSHIKTNGVVKVKLKIPCTELRELIKVAISLQIAIKIEEFSRRGR